MRRTVVPPIGVAEPALAAVTRSAVAAETGMLYTDRLRQSWYSVSYIPEIPISNFRLSDEAHTIECMSATREERMYKP